MQTATKKETKDMITTKANETIVVDKETLVGAALYLDFCLSKFRLAKHRFLRHFAPFDLISNNRSGTSTLG